MIKSAGRPRPKCCWGNDLGFVRLNLYNCSDKASGQPRLEQNASQKRLAAILGTLRIEVTNTTIWHLASNKMAGTNELRIITTILATSIQSSDTISIQSINIQHLSKITLRITSKRLFIFEVIHFANLSLAQSSRSTTIDSIRQKRSNNSSNNSKTSNNKNKITHIKPFVRKQTPTTTITILHTLSTFVKS